MWSADHHLSKIHRGRQRTMIKYYNQGDCEPVTINRCNLSRSYAQLITVIIVICALEYNSTNTDISCYHHIDVDEQCFRHEEFAYIFIIIHVYVHNILLHRIASHHCFFLHNHRIHDYEYHIYSIIYV